MVKGICYNIILLLQFHYFFYIRYDRLGIKRLHYKLFIESVYCMAKNFTSINHIPISAFIRESSNILNNHRDTYHLSYRLQPLNIEIAFLNLFCRDNLELLTIFTDSHNTEVPGQDILFQYTSSIKNGIKTLKEVIYTIFQLHAIAMYLNNNRLGNICIHHVAHIFNLFNVMNTENRLVDVPYILEPLIRTVPYIYFQAYYTEAIHAYVNDPCYNVTHWSSEIYSYIEHPYVSVWRVNKLYDMKITIPITSNSFYDMIIYWGDDTVEHYKSIYNGNNLISHQYEIPNNYVIRIYGIITGYSHGIYRKKSHRQIPIHTSHNIINILQWGILQLDTGGYQFADTMLEHIDASDVPNISTITNLRGMFMNNHELLDAIHINEWDVSNINNMCAMFKNAYQFNSDINLWNVTRVYNMSHMFHDARVFNSCINNWNVNNVRNVSHMFQNATMFNRSLHLWDTSNFLTTKCMFMNAVAFNHNINTWNTLKITDMSYMFYGCSNYNQPMNNFNMSQVDNISHMFHNAIKFNYPLNLWDTSSIIDMSHCFRGTLNFNQGIQNWDVSSVEDMSFMFYKARYKDILKLQTMRWNTLKCNNYLYMFM